MHDVSSSNERASSVCPCVCLSVWLEGLALAVRLSIVSVTSSMNDALRIKVSRVRLRASSGSSSNGEDDASQSERYSPALLAGYEFETVRL